MLTLAFEKLHREFIKVSDKGAYFVGAETGRRFVPVGFNYDHDEQFRLLESYWHDEWDVVEKDFAAMKALGANVVRIHLQLNKFLSSPTCGDEKEFRQLDRLIELAASLEMYLDLVGLCCYHPWEVPEWYDRMDYGQRWETQSFFWQLMAKRYANEKYIFCFDLMNEPVVPTRKRPLGSWLGKDYAGKNYIQFLVLDGTKKPRYEVALEWLSLMKESIRQYDTQHMITVGLVDWSLQDRKMKSGFFPNKIKQYVDFIGCHLYPEEGKPGEMLKILDGFRVGIPVVIDETFHIKCQAEEHAFFLREASRVAQGFMSFYTELQPNGKDDGRNRVIMEARNIFKEVAPLFK